MDDAKVNGSMFAEVDGVTDLLELDIVHPQDPALLLPAAPEKPQVLSVVPAVILEEKVTFKQRMLAKTISLGVDEEMLAAQFAHVIKGVTIKKVFTRRGNKPDGEPNMELSREELTARPEDMLRGLILADSLRGGSLGLAPKDRVFRNPGERVHQRIAQDSRIDVSIVEEK